MESAIVIENRVGMKCLVSVCTPARMDKLTRYREAVKACLLDWYAYIRRGGPQNGVEPECVFDEARDNYLITFTGWHNNRRHRSDYIFVRIRNDKIWVEEDWTEEGIANELVRAGVPKEDIVLAFHPPELRHLTEFAPA